jgi:Zn-dependent peptidase ImmA (M78 family)
MSVRRKLIRALVQRLLTEQGVGSGPVDVEKLAGLLGIDVRKQNAGPDLSGFILRNPENGKVVIGVNRAHAPTRQRFTIAHELGHFHLHEGEALRVDRTHAFRVNLRDDIASKGTDTEEKEANLFAAELLVPNSFLRKDLREHGTLDLGDERAIAKWAKRYQVSPQMLTFRLTYLGVQF